MSTIKTGGWLPSHVAVLKRCVKNATSKQAGFDEASKILNRKAMSCQSKWYNLEAEKQMAKAADRMAKAAARTLVAAQDSFFEIEDNWTPTKVFTTDLDQYLKSMINTAEMLKPGQSFAIPASTLKSRYNWGDGATNSVRYVLKKNMVDSQYGRIKIHEIRDNEKKLVNIRVRRVQEA